MVTWILECPKRAVTIFGCTFALIKLWHENLLGVKSLPNSIGTGLVGEAINREAKIVGEVVATAAPI